ncbi:hypothetical protein MWMV17_MWMV17_02067 [Acinetobacter calcoaceticus]|uniref:Uncharacterized protein n=1 Tax=Acinetobacter calcoaceticus DSM 30006 = CIP 81.8 TaxID=981331 RepID=A0ABN0K986_ACICA|nr:hypothetical protein [Acinetobacter calcoaceticus]ENW00488.1 hypothetical protein F936_01061 [Acinetobacter calcoaceticus DSM 30006 = CIP 81.8]CAI3139250.1 hypothetical protein MWMV17_MWMV17_02067 [Acinetobacter calcoaceticus]SUU61374.1 Uncharacterised protein [Acinetobacter calcoaceticus]
MSYKIFKGNHQYYHLNACVGNNGWTGISTYLEGYQAATIAMLESILDKKALEGSEIIFWTQDTAIYPIVFTARHSIELFLKAEINNINTLKKYLSPIQKELTVTHNIQKLWNIFKSQLSFVGDNRLNYIVLKLENAIEEYSKIDPNGETFRYPYSNEDKKHLEEVSLINIYDFYINYLELAKEMQDFQVLVSCLQNEYSTGTYTKKLNRKDFEDISKSLPLREEWAEINFKKIKEDIKNKYNLSGRELSSVLDQIQNHYEFSLNIIPNNFLLKIDKNILIQFCNGLVSKDQLINLNKEYLITLRSLIEMYNYGYPVFSERINQYEEYFKEMGIDCEIDYIFRKYNKVKLFLTERLNYNFLFEDQ